MDVHRLVEMANQIGKYFSYESDEKVAAENIANHLKKFWDPRMRKQLIEYVNSGGDELDSAVTLATRLLN